MKYMRLHFFFLVFWFLFGDGEKSFLNLGLCSVGGFFEDFVGFFFAALGI